jgi:hypothetical protein
MKAIHKYELKLIKEQTITLGISSTIIRVDNVGGKFFLWALVDTEDEIRKEVDIRMYKTGQEIPDETDILNLNYLGFISIEFGQELGLYVFEVL